jgi:hypothetical protein
LRRSQIRFSSANPFLANDDKKRLGLKEFKAEVEKKATEDYRKRISVNLAGDALSDWLAAKSEVKRSSGFLDFTLTREQLTHYNFHRSKINFIIHFRYFKNIKIILNAQLQS